jgi:HPt (histidine-containing phosphotransfer) domain-containing protein
MIDWPRVQELWGEIGAEDFDEVVELFLDEVGEIIAQLQSGVELSQLEQELHCLKGSALNLGFSSFSKLCQEGELLAASGRAAEIDLQPIFDCFDASRAVFTRDLPTLGVG